ncbi:MAG TPA: SpoIIE family protein phosphatase [bacterium]|nr:SpoIIE family protein phosphatase [bacterium]
MNIFEGKSANLEWAFATEALSGEVDCGDHGVVQPFDGGILLGVIDGIGHGKEASAAALVAAELLKLRPRDSVISLVQLIHDRLRTTRGVVMTLASLNCRDNTLTWIGVGNVAGTLHSRNSDGALSAESVVLRGGMIGVQLPPLRAEVLPLRKGSLLIFATDGVYGGVSVGVNMQGPVREICERMMREYSKGQDDALVLAARYLGGDDEEAST